MRADPWPPDALLLNAMLRPCHPAGAGNSAPLMLPVNTTLELVGARGFEPPTPCSRSKCATRLRYAPPDRQPVNKAHPTQLDTLKRFGWKTGVIAICIAARKRSYQLGKYLKNS